MRQILATALGGLALVAAPSFAHHSAVMFDDATCLSEFFERQASAPGAVHAALGPRIRRAR